MLIVSLNVKLCYYTGPMAPCVEVKLLLTRGLQAPSKPPIQGEMLRISPGSRGLYRCVNSRSIRVISPRKGKITLLIGIFKYLIVDIFVPECCFYFQLLGLKISLNRIFKMDHSQIGCVFKPVIWLKL